MIGLFRSPPIQEAITMERIECMLALRPRRTQLGNGVEWRDPLHPPSAGYANWTVVLPFCETLANCFHLMCDVPGNGLRPVKGERCQAFLDDANEDPASLERVRAWLALVGQFVAIRDCLALSFALDYDREGGSPTGSTTKVGALRARAKPYAAVATADTHAAARELVAEPVAFLEAMTCYNFADVVLAMPPSSPDKAFDLPRELAAGIAAARGLPDVSLSVVTSRARPGLKNLPLAEKMAALQGTIQVDADAVQGKVVLLVDDLYQSGISMNYVAFELLSAGAGKVLGLACEKTCRNDDNVRGTR